IHETIAALMRAVRSAGLEVTDIARVLLVGGSSRIPLVAQMVREATGVPIALDAHPKHAIALGAALAASHAVTTEKPQTAAVPVTSQPAAPEPEPAIPAAETPTVAAAAAANPLMSTPPP